MTTSLALSSLARAAARRARDSECDRDFFAIGSEGRGIYHNYTRETPKKCPDSPHETLALTRPALQPYEGRTWMDPSSGSLARTGNKRQAG